MAPILTLLVILTVSILITRVVTAALVLTGMSHEAARFQARSAFSGVGYTTREAESIVSHPVRRRIIMLAMLLGNIGIATVMATVIMSFISTAQAPERRWLNVLFLFIGLAVLWVAAASKRLERGLNRIITAGLHRWTRLDLQDYVAILQLENGYAVSEMKVEPEDWLAGKSLQEAALTTEGVLVLGIKKPSGSYLGAPRGAARIETDDVLILYAPIHRLEELDRRRAGPPGEMAHEEAVAENVGGEG
jgi:hypothetical protein